MFRTFLHTLTCGLLLASCGHSRTKAVIQPTLSFIEISKGNLETPVDELLFSSRFQPEDRNLIGVVGFTTISDGTTVQATWFSPDDRTMPIGREKIVTSDNVDVVRFLISPSENWTPAPYLLDIRAWNDDPNLAVSGSAQFFVGLNDQEIEMYRKEYKEWQSNQ